MITTTSYKGCWFVSVKRSWGQTV